MSCNWSKMLETNGIRYKLLGSDPNCLSGISICPWFCLFCFMEQFFLIYSVNLRRSAFKALCASSRRTIRGVFQLEKMSWWRQKIKVLELPSNQTFQNRVKKWSKLDFLCRNKQIAGWFRDVPDRPWGRGSTGVLWVGANRIPINYSIFSKNGTVSLANLHTFVPEKIWTTRIKDVQ